MKNSKLASLLSKLSQKEFKEFGKFVKSPYFNSNSNVVKLYDLIAKYFPNIEHPKLAKENIYLHIYPDEKYKDSTARGLISAALKITEEFLVANHIKVNNYKYKEVLLTELCERRIFDLFNIHFKESKNEMERTAKKDEDYFFFRYRLEILFSSIESKAYTPLTQKDIPGDIQTHDTENLINFFLISILKRYTYLQTKVGSLNVSLNLNFFDEIMDYLKKTDLENIPILNYYYNRAMLYLSGMEEKYFLSLRKILYKNFDDIDRYEQYNIFTNLQNYCVRRYKITGENTAEVQYDLYKFGMKKNILTFDEFEPISTILFANIVSAATSLGKINEAKEFINNYKDRVAPERKDTAVNFNMAKIYFKEKEYDKSLTSLSVVHSQDVFDKISVKNLYAMVYYDAGYIEELVLLLETYRSFLNKNIIIGQRLKESNLNFITYLQKLVKLKDIGSKSELNYLKHEVQNTDSLYAKDWLLDSIDKLL